MSRRTHRVNSHKIFMDYLQKIKEYYKNSPKRIGWTWFAVHLFFLIVALVWVGGGIDILYLYGSLIFAGIFIYLFPISFTMFLSSIAPPFFLASPILNVITILISPAYYILFFFILFKAKDTSAKSFRILNIIFLVWFLLALVFSFFAINYFLTT